MAASWIWIIGRMRAAHRGLRICLMMLQYPPYHRDCDAYLVKFLQTCEQVEQLLDELEAVSTAA